MRYFLFLIFIFQSIHSFAISEFNYAQNYKNLILPYMESLDSSFFESYDGLHIHYLMENANKDYQNCLIILPGQSESAVQYSELAFDLKQTNFGANTKIFILDIRGQGSSDRMVLPNDLGHVGHFFDYTKDLDYFLSIVVDNNICSKKYLFAHSMGAGIAISYLVNHSDYFSAAVISSPMLKVQTSPLPYEFVKLFATEEVIRGNGAKFSIGQSGFDPNESFEKNDYTNSKVRHQMMMNLYEQFPETKIGGLSNRWVYEVMKETRIRRKVYRRISTPIKLFRAEIESTVSSTEMKKFCHSATHCEETYIPKARHAIFNDQDSVRDYAISELLVFFQNN